LNRIIFLRICEDRGHEKYETLKKIRTYAELRAIFSDSEKRYDSGLFDLIDEQTLRVTDSVLISIFSDLYYPNSSYEFSVVDPYIIGQVYEIFLEESITVNFDDEIEIVKKPESIQSQGAVSTPKKICDVIVGESLDTIYSGKEPDEVSAYRVGDICCGSGNFLISAFEYIVNYHILYYIYNGKDEAMRSGTIHETTGESYKLSFSKRREILENNIWGVDIDPLAVEVTKFSLTIKLLEDVTPQEICDYTKLSHKQILPDLDRNVLVGNSLVDRKYSEQSPEVLENPELMMKIKMFDWNNNFGGKKFDAIVGNPPYIRVQNMVHYSKEEYNYYKSGASGYVSAEYGLPDKYLFFVERSLSLLSDSGVMGYIIPHKFMVTETGEGLREVISRGGHVKKIIHFGAEQVFPNRATYTCILILTKRRQIGFEIGMVKSVNSFLSERKVHLNKYNEGYLTEKPWTFIQKEVSDALGCVRAKCSMLSYMADIFVGVQTSADKIFVLKPEHDDGNSISFIDKNGNEQKVEKAILKRCIYDIQIKKYKAIESNTFIIFPYKIVDGKQSLYTTEEMKSLFPEAYAYLLSHKKDLDERNMKRYEEHDWYAYGRTQSLNKFSGSKHLLWPVLSTGPNYVYDDQSVVFTGGGNGPFYGLQVKSTTKESIFFVQAILNHWLMEELIKGKGSVFRGQYYSHGKQFVSTLPIIRIDFEDSHQRQVHDEIVGGVKTLMEQSKILSPLSNKYSRNTVEEVIRATEAKVSKLIDGLYGICQEDIMIDRPEENAEEQ